MQDDANDRAYASGRQRLSQGLSQETWRVLRAVQLLLGQTKIESTVRYLGMDVDDALVIAGQAV
jgi:hypothetical protein